MEENPFVFGKAVEGDLFTDRIADAEHLEGCRSFAGNSERLARSSPKNRQRGSAR